MLSVLNYVHLIFTQLVDGFPFADIAETCNILIFFFNFRVKFNFQLPKVLWALEESMILRCFVCSASWRKEPHSLPSAGGGLLVDSNMHLKGASAVGLELSWCTAFLCQASRSHFFPKAPAFLEHCFHPHSHVLLPLGPAGKYMTMFL